jgi:hypothetical protein
MGPGASSNEAALFAPAKTAAATQPQLHSVVTEVLFAGADAAADAAIMTTASMIA